MTLLVSVHDVTPAFAPEVARLWAMCRRHSVTPALLVVPDWHDQWPLERHPEFVEWLLGCAGEGVEIVHGSVAVARGRLVLHRRARFPRLALHPEDLSHPAVAQSLEPTLERWLARHEPGAYAEVLSAVTA